jgi:hypothetical protein
MALFSKTEMEPLILVDSSTKRSVIKAPILWSQKDQKGTLSCTPFDLLFELDIFLNLAQSMK